MHTALTKLTAPHCTPCACYHAPAEELPALPTELLEEIAALPPPPEPVPPQPAPVPPPQPGPTPLPSGGNFGTRTRNDFYGQNNRYIGNYPTLDAAIAGGEAFKRDNPGATYRVEAAGFSDQILIPDR